MDVLRTLTSLNLPLRGSSSDVDASDCGVYLSIMKLLARYVPQPQSHFNSAAKIKYLSNTIIEEQVEILAQVTRRDILKEIEHCLLDCYY